MSAPPARTRPSSRSRTSSGASSTASSGGSTTAMPPASWIAATYERAMRKASWSQTPHRARSTAAQIPITGRAIADSGYSTARPRPGAAGRSAAAHDRREEEGAVEHRFPRLVHAQDRAEPAGRRGQPVRALVPAGVVVLDDDRERPVVVAAQAPGAVADRVAVDRVGDEEELRQVVHRDRP